MTDMEHRFVWVFNGANASFPSAVFSALELAADWIGKNRLTGVLTRYPVDISAYDWSVSERLFAPKKQQHSEPDFIGSFTGGEIHHHYENGVLEA